MGFPEVSDFGEGVRQSVGRLYRRWDGDAVLPPNKDDLADFLVTLTVEGEGWFPNPNTHDVGMVAERLKNAGLLSTGEHFTIVEPADASERLTRLADAIRRRLCREDEDV